MSKNAHRHVITLVVCGLLTALGVILGGLLSIPAVPFGSYSLKIGFGVLPVILSGVLFGPAYGGIVGALTDLIQALLFPKGAYMPWFTVVGIFRFGARPVFMKKQKPTFVRLLAAVAAGQLFGSVFLNTLLLVELYGSPWQLIWVRLANQAVMIPLYAALLYAVCKLLARHKVLDKLERI